MNDTDLRLEIIGRGNSIGLFAARGCTQTLSLLSEGITRRTINGDLICVGSGGHRKFTSIISCKDKAPPGFDGLWKGSLLKVGCIQTLSCLVPSHRQKIQVERESISTYLQDYSGNPYPVKKLEKREFEIPQNFPGGFLIYRPELKMVVQNYFLETDEWELTVGWTLELEEE